MLDLTAITVVDEGDTKLLMLSVAQKKGLRDVSMLSDSEIIAEIEHMEKRLDRMKQRGYAYKLRPGLTHKESADNWNKRIGEYERDGLLICAELARKCKFQFSRLITHVARSRKGDIMS